jgi:hypothetical protein
MKMFGRHYILTILALELFGGAALRASDAPMVPLVPPPDSEAAPGFYSVKESENQIELSTPYGTIQIPTGFGANVPYRLSIPLEDLKKGAPSREFAPADGGKAPEPREDGQPAPLNLTSAQKSGPLFASPASPTPTVIVDDADTLVVDANRLFNRRRYYEALTVVDQILRKRPDFTRGWLMKGSLLLVQGHKELAMKAWRKAKEIEPENPEVLAVLERYQ